MKKRTFQILDKMNQEDVINNTQMVCVGTTLIVTVSAKNKNEARSKALDRLSKKNPTSLIRKSWPDNRKEIDIEES